MVLSTLGQSFSFHSSPESFISSRLQDLAISDPEQLPSTTGKKNIVVASILNRKVHIVSSYQLCKDILEASSSASSSNLTPSTITATAAGIFSQDVNPRSLDADILAAGPAYHQLMSDFFPPPNILLEDGTTHAVHKRTWADQLSTFACDSTPQIRQITEKHISSLLHPATGGADGKVDLYETLKSLAWEILLSVFLDLSPSSSPEEFSQVESLQETLLRGQFSLFPVSINTRLWQSPRSKGIKARKDLQVNLGEIINRQEAGCPFLKQGATSKEDAANHALLFTSSLAVKALASLLTAFVLNLYLWRDRGHGYMEDGDGIEEVKGPTTTSLAELIRSQGDLDAQARMLRSILLETERLSPPIVGVMRRVQRDIVLKPHQQSYSQSETETPTSTATRNMNNSMTYPPPSPPPEGNAMHHAVPAGHDIWLYLSGASRDPTVFGNDADLFRFDRYMPSPSSSSSTSNKDLHSHSDSDSFDPPPSLVFSAGPKTCLGTELVRQIVLTVGKAMVDVGVEMEGMVEDRGVRGWLGWDAGVQPEWVAKGMKQLPVQRPRVGVRVGIFRKG
ncbi:hypothetical protein EPUS_06792 [Endocarpon pusillum Z07020]|uniref:Cytochrome P450 n=1 Tax=Endocarpon pusillum (strain Z07020 / HMAS-L-300199) TaxID=1263415 RepID=U1G9K3_ENDPU|nr:uncharacterized protein EPUS_06792 [Endocarpon pusillum Z07020]ERF68376.1 hypothetical protein EPUS_06792 [Endocarpon pusillum Z07020]